MVFYKYGSQDLFLTPEYSHFPDGGARFYRSNHPDDTQGITERKNPYNFAIAEVPKELGCE